MNLTTFNFRLGHFLLTELLLPLLKKSAASGFRPRIVIVSSVAHTAATSMHWEDLNWEKSYDKNRAYAQSKLANVLHAKELARRLKDEGISVFSLHPGVIDSELWRHQRQAWYGRLWAPIIMCFFKTELQGAQVSKRRAANSGKLVDIGHCIALSTDDHLLLRRGVD